MLPILSIRELVWKVLVDSECGEPLLTEAKKIISHNSQSLYQNSKDHEDFISYLLSAGKLTSLSACMYRPERKSGGKNDFLCNVQCH